MMFFFRDPDSKGAREDTNACIEMVLDMQERLSMLQLHWQEQGCDNPFVIGIGINTGYYKVGNFSSDQHLASASSAVR